MSTNVTNDRFIGLNKNDLPTPSLLLDLDVFEKNIRKMSEHSKTTGINLRPHTKAHKCPEIARRQKEAGAIGICVATINEAEAMVEAGITGILITSAMAGQEKINRLVNLTKKQPDLLSVIDHPIHAEQLNEAGHKAGVTINVLIDIDPNLNRTGISAGDEAISLAEKIAKLPNLNLRGIQCYSGRSAHIVGYEERKAHSFQAMSPGVETFLQLRKLGFPMEIMSGGSTGTYNIDPHLEGMTELQVGSYIFMDTDYSVIGGKENREYNDFGNSLTILTTVVSKNHPGIATVDAGIKAMATDRSFLPKLKDMKEVTYEFSGDEHGRLSYSEPSITINLGDRLEITPPHCDPTVNLYSRIFCLRDGKVEAVWPIVGRY